MARILFVNTRYRPPYFRGGVERYVHVLSSRFARLGHECQVVAFEEPLECRSDVPHSFIAAPKIPLLRPLLFSWFGRRLWNAADLVVLQYTPLGLLMPKNKLICTVHTTGYGEAQALRRSSASLLREWKRARRLISLPFERYVLRRARRIIAISEQIAEELVSAYGIPRDRIAVVGTGVDCEEFRPDAAPKGHTPFRVLYVGRLAPRKKVDVLLAALARCTTDAQLRIVGTGPEAAHLEALSASLGVADRVTFAGFRAGPDLLREYHWADLLVMPSSYEGMPLVALEAQAAGLPVLAADFPGATNVVRKNAGQVLPGADGDSLARAIDQLARDATQLNRLASGARTEALNSFSWDAVVRGLTDQYSAVLQPRATS